MALTDVQGGPAPPVDSSAAASTTASKFKAAAPVAAGGLALVLAVVAGSMITGNGADQPLPSEATVSSSEAPTSAAPGEPTSAPLPIDPAANPPVITQPKPGSAIPGVAFDQAPPAGVAQGIEIVVKFKDDAKIKDIIDSFWKDQPSAKAKFDALKARRPEFANLKLDRVTYSNELVLVHDGSAPVGQRLAAMRETASKLGKAADISYAEPNLTAQPGGQ